MKKIRLFWIAFFVLTLNLIWEFSHHILYVDLTGIPLIPHLILASFTDLFLVWFILVLNSILRKNLDWMEKPKKSDYVVITTLGILIAAAIEVYSVSRGRWAYTELMPTFLGIGISPLVQLFSTSSISLWLVNKIFNKK